MRSWNFEVGGLYLSERSMKAYSELQERLWSILAHTHRYRTKKRFLGWRASFLALRLDASSVRDPFDQGAREVGSAGTAAQIAGPHTVDIQRLAECGAQAHRQFRQATVLEHHGGGEYESGRIGYFFSGN